MPQKTVVVDQAEWEQMKRAVGRVDRKSVLAAGLRRIGRGIASGLNIPMNVLAGFWCMLWFAVKSVVYVITYGSFAIFFGPTAIRCSQEWEDECGKDYHLTEFSSFSLCVLILCTGALVCGDLNSHSRIAQIILAWVGTNTFSLAHELGRWKRGRKVTATKEAGTATGGGEATVTQTVAGFASQPIAATPVPTAQQTVSDRTKQLIAHATAECYELTLTFDSIASLVADGKYNYANPDITADHFPAIPKQLGTTEAFLVGFNEYVTLEDAESSLAAKGLRPATAREGLHFGIQHPDRQRKNGIVCLGDNCQDSSGDVAVLFGDAGDRYANLFSRRSEWGSVYRFLAFRKSS